MAASDFSALNSTLAADEPPLFFALHSVRGRAKFAYLEDAARLQRVLCVCLRFANLALFQQNKMVMKSQTKSVVASKLLLPAINSALARINIHILAETEQPLTVNRLMNHLGRS